jgi:hypothetical protein
MKAKIVTTLTSPPPVDAEHREPFGTLQHVAHIPQPGIICQLKLGAAGLQYCRGGVTTHVVPTAVLITYFESLEPKFGEGPKNASGAPAETRPQQVDDLGAPSDGEDATADQAKAAPSPAANAS